MTGLCHSSTHHARSMPYDPNRHHRKSIRLKHHDYVQPGAYFITVCVQDRMHAFGEIHDGVMQCNAAGLIAHRTLQSLPQRFPNIEMDETIVMPDHIHTIIRIHVGARFIAPTTTPELKSQNEFDLVSRDGGIEPRDTAFLARGSGAGSGWEGVMNHAPTVGEMVRVFKAVMAVRIRRAGWDGFGWQRNYFETIIRNEQHLEHTRAYIQHNPSRWLDRQGAA